MELMNASSALALFETTKAQRESFAQAIVSEIKEGNIDPLKIHMQLKSAEHLLKSTNENPEYKSLLLEAAEKHGKKFETYNAEFQIKEAGTKWDYSQTNDTTLFDMMRRAEDLDNKIKARQKFLQTIPAAGVADPETGEMLYPATKSSQTIVSCTLK